jgi:hypothetical protein
MSMRSWIRRLFTRPATRPIRKVPHRARLDLEVLEDRTVPATASITVTPYSVTYDGNPHTATGSAIGTVTQTISRVGHWSFDETSGTVAHEATGLSSSGQLYNFPGDNSEWVPGQIGGALHFGGPSTRQSVIAPNYPKTQSVSFSGWVYADTNTVEWQSISKNWGDTVHGQFHFGLDASTGRLGLYIIQSDGTPIGPVEDPNPFPTGQWEQVGFVINSGSHQLEVYCNGALVASGSYDGTLVDPPISSLGIGVKTDNTGAVPDPSVPGYWQGSFDDFALWNGALSAADMASIYANGVNHQSAPAQVVHGIPLDGLDLSGTTRTSAGTYTETWTFTDPTGNYDNASGTVTVTIAKAPLTVTANAAIKTYDNVAYSGGNGVSYSAFVNGETSAVLSGTVAYGGTAQGAVNTGTYSITPSGLTSGNYDITYVAGTLLVGNATSQTANFNGTAIPAGNYVWFSSVLKPSGLSSTEATTIWFVNQTITIGSQVVPVPNASITYHPRAGTSSTVFTADGWWKTDVYLGSGLSGNQFLSGLGFYLPSGLAGGTKNVTWSGVLFTDQPGVSLNWKWVAAVYTHLP